MNNQSIGDIIDSILKDVNVNNQIKSCLDLIGWQSDKINELEKQISSSGKKLPCWVYWVWLIVIVSLGLSVSSLFIRVGYNWNVEIVSISIILAFVGILATFVVISNYAQAREIKNEYDKKTKELESKFEEKTVVVENKFKSEIQAIEKLFNEKLKETEDRVELLSNHVSYSLFDIYLNNKEYKQAFYSLYSLLRHIKEDIVVERIADDALGKTRKKGVVFSDFSEPRLIYRRLEDLPIKTRSIEYLIEFFRNEHERMKG